MHGAWRRWLAGSKRGAARSVGVFGSPGFDEPEQPLELLGRCTRLRDLARIHGVILADDPDSLSVVDRHLDAWNTQPPRHPFVEHEIGCYLGTVIVTHVPHTRWRLWPNGHPVVQLSSGADVDVIREAGRRRGDHRRTLTSIYADAIR